MASVTLLRRLRALIASCCFFGSPPPALEDDDILGEILLRLPPLPSSLLRASLVCERWRGVLAAPHFRRRFRARHGAPPLLGVFDDTAGFTPLLPAPDRVPISVPQPRGGGRLFFRGARHGLALLLNLRRLEAVAWDPITGCQHTVPYPPEFRAAGRDRCNQGAVLRNDDGGFKVVLARTERSGGGGDTTMIVFMAVFDSATGRWSAATSAAIPPTCSFLPNTVLVRNALCGFFHWPAGILEFDLDASAVGVVQKPASIRSDYPFSGVVRTQDGELGIVNLGDTFLRLWGRTTTAHGGHGAAAAAEWVLHKTVDLETLVFPHPPAAADSARLWRAPRVVGYDEDNNVIHLAVSDRVFTLNLDTLQCSTQDFNCQGVLFYYPYTSFCTSGARCLQDSHAKDEEIASWCNFFHWCK